ncbi:replication factor C subunit 4 [Elasticomyces elasticus]|uniref:Replication factor C subunit 4 n=1 Tax=Exophiala sideris TaxID=1016849 RepID=A0ABR0JL45_9EURO|nr:replication factor C subunit 4 [Elasticomyces elasticus]KAK5036327.1 replication factor C subunit 4 [Exophiala sideris]KAK5041842.1 replication factor C subunit 4 [Exophiala sideris]KAK5066710.1 replication factor C subunit 4 [Exophiala sideris]KAK5184768.1 replication factor C subunit 4 [Eurotiomycetes sp. CCFEE 6388]
MPAILNLRYLKALCGLSLTTQAFAQDVDECGLTCIADVDGTDCTQSDWPCLCANNMYIERMNDCTVASCNAASQQNTSEAIAQICAIFSVTLTNSPEATAPTSVDNTITAAIPTQSSISPITMATGQSWTTTSGYVTVSVSPARNLPSSTVISISGIGVNSLTTNAISPLGTGPWNFSTTPVTVTSGTLATTATAVTNESARSYSLWIWTLISSLVLILCLKA